MRTQLQLSPHKRKACRIFAGGLVVLSMLVVGTLIAGVVARSNLTRQHPASGQLVDVGGYRMHIQCHGQGSPTVILVGGLDDFSITWSLVQPAVAKTTRVCAYDRAGLGWSEASPYPRTSANMVEELQTLLVNAKLESPYVMVGHSFGGALAQYRAISAATDYYETCLAESEMFEKNLAEMRPAHLTSPRDLPLVVLSRGTWDAMPELSETENQQAKQAWADMQATLLNLSSNSTQVIADQSEHFIQLQQPQLVTDTIGNVVEVIRE